MAFACKSAPFGAELQVSIGPRPHLSFCAWKTACFHQNDKSIWVPALIFFFFFSSFKTVTLGPDWQVSIGPSPHLRNLDSKQRLFTGITSLYGSQTWPVILCIQNSVISIRITSLYGPKPLSVAFACKPVPFGAELQVSIGPQTSPVVWCLKNPVIFTRTTSLYGFQPSPFISFFLHSKQRLWDQTDKSLWVPDIICGYEHT